MSVGAMTLVSSLFDIKHYFHLQFSPHVTHHYQYWRIFVHPLACTSSASLLLVELILYTASITIERQFGSLKYASFIAISAILSSALSFLALFGFQKTSLNVIPAGPVALLFSIVYQYYRLLPPAYSFQLFAFKFSNKAYLYVLAYQLAVSQLPGSAAAAIIGILTGQLYRSDVLGLRSYRLPPFVQKLGSSLLPYIGSTRPARRSNLAMPDSLPTEVEEPISTAPSPDTNQTAPAGADQANRSVMSQWVNQLTGQTSTSGIHVSTEAEISQVASMFPNTPRESVILALQRSSNVEEAVETLLAANNG